MRAKIWLTTILSVVLLALNNVAMSAPKSYQDWVKCSEKAESSVNEREVGVLGVEMAIKEKCGSPPVQESGTAAGVGVHPNDLVRSKAWKKKFMSLLQGKYKGFVERLTVSGNTRQEGEWIIGEGLAPHMGGVEEAVFVIHVPTSRVFAAMLEDGKQLTGFGFGSSWDNAPGYLKAWAKDRLP